MKKKDTLGTLMGNTPSAALDTVTPANKHGGLYPGQSQPTGSRLLALGEPGIAERFNRALGAVQQGVDTVVGTFSSDTVIARRFTTAEIAALTAVNAASVTISTIAAPFDPCYLYVGLNADQMGIPIAFAYAADAVARRQGQLVYASISDIDNGGATSYLATNALIAEAARDHLPDTLTTPVAIGTVAGGSFAAQLFYRDGIRLTTSWRSTPVFALRGAYLRVGGTLNAGWWRIIDFSDDGYTAIVNKTAAKKIFVDTTSGSGLAAWTAIEGQQFIGPSGQIFYLMDTVDLGGGLGVLYVYPFSGTTRNGYPINDVRSLALGDTLSDVVTAGAITIDVVAAGTVYEETDESILLDIGASTGPSTIDVFCPPGFVPLGCGVNVTVDFSENLPYVAPPGGEDLTMYGAVLMQPDDKLRSGGIDDSDTYSTQQETLHPAYLSLMFENLSRVGTNGDRKLRVVTHVSDSSVYQISVVDTATGAVVFGVDETGNFVSTAGAAPFDFFRSASLIWVENMSMGQAIDMNRHTPMLYTDPAFARVVGPETIDYTTLAFSTAGQYYVLSGAGKTIAPGAGWGTTTWFIYFDASVGSADPHSDILLTTTPAVDINPQDIPGGANDYPTGSDVLLGVVTTSAGAIVSITPALKVAGLEATLPITVGGDAANFDDLQDAFDFIAAVYTLDQFPYPAEIQIVRPLTVTGNYTLNLGAPTGYDLGVKIIGATRGPAINWAPAGAGALFNVTSGCVDMERLVVKIDMTAGAQPFMLYDAAGYVRLQDIRVEPTVPGTDYLTYFLRVWSSAGIKEVADIDVVGCVAPCTIEAIDIESGAGTCNVTRIFIDRCKFNLELGGGSAIYLVPDTVATVEVLVRNVRLISDTAANPLEYGVRSDCARATIENLIVEGYATNGICLTANASGTIIRGGLLSQEGVALSLPDARGVYAFAASEITIEGVTFRPGLGYSVEFTGANVTVCNCRIECNAIDADYSGTIYGRAGAVSASLRENYFYGKIGRHALSPAILFEGATSDLVTIDNNKFYLWGDAGWMESGVAGAILNPTDFQAAGKAFAGFEGRILLIWDADTDNIGGFRISSVSVGPDDTLTCDDASFDGVPAGLVWAIPPAVIVVDGLSVSLTGNEIYAVGDPAVGEGGIGVFIQHPLLSRSSYLGANKVIVAGQAFVSNRAPLTVEGGQIQYMSHYGIIVRKDHAFVGGVDLNSVDCSGIWVHGSGIEADGSHICGNRIRTVGNTALTNTQCAIYTSGASSNVSGNTLYGLGANIATSIYTGATSVVVGNHLDGVDMVDTTTTPNFTQETITVAKDATVIIGAIVVVVSDDPPVSGAATAFPHPRFAKLFSADAGVAGHRSKIMCDGATGDFIPVYYDAFPASNFVHAVDLYVDSLATDPTLWFTSYNAGFTGDYDLFVETAQGRFIRIVSRAWVVTDYSVYLDYNGVSGGVTASETGLLYHRGAPATTYYPQTDPTQHDSHRLNLNRF